MSPKSKAKMLVHLCVISTDTAVCPCEWCYITVWLMMLCDSVANGELPHDIIICIMARGAVYGSGV